MDRADERRRQSRKRDLQPMIVAPVSRGATPAEGREAVDLLPCSGRTVAHRRQIGKDADIPEDDREDQIADDRPEVPDERAAPLRPDPHRVGIGREPVEIEWSPEMKDREEPGDRHREQRHRLGETADRGAPRLAGEHEQGGDQRARVAEADPPDVVRDREARYDAGVVAEDADALGEQRVDAIERSKGSGGADEEGDPPKFSGRTHERRADEVGDRPVIDCARKDRKLLQRGRTIEGGRDAHAPPPSSGFELRSFAR